VVPLVIAEVDDQAEIIAASALYPLPDHYTAYIPFLAVSRSHRKQGLATQLLNNLIQFAEEHSFTNIVLKVDKKNAQAINLYKALGFSTVGQVISPRNDNPLSSYDLQRYHQSQNYFYGPRSKYREIVEGIDSKTLLQSQYQPSGSYLMQKLLPSEKRYIADVFPNYYFAR
jgi:RimJ/RimL family protein N-acetyltransferase